MTRSLGAVVLLSMGALPGCDGLDWDALGGRAEVDISSANVEKIAADPAGLTFRFTVTPPEPASWVDIFMAQSNLPPICGDGGGYAVTAISPVPSFSPGGEPLKHQAGTVFTQTIRCPSPLPGEFAVAADLPIDEAKRLVTERLNAAGERAPTHTTVTSISYNDHQRKYDAIQHLVGSQVAHRIRDCGGAISVNAVIAAVYPKPAPEDGVFLNRAEIVVGTDISCSDAGPVAGFLATRD